MRLLVCGGRDFKNYHRVFDVLDKVHRKYKISLLIHGAQRTYSHPDSNEPDFGADFIASEWAKSRGIKEKPFPADWKTHGKPAGFIRNAEMAKEKLDMAISFSGGNGTAMMMRLLKGKTRRFAVKPRKDDKIYIKPKGLKNG